MSASHAAFLNTLDRTHSIRDKSDRVDPGVWTDKNRKRDYKTAAQKALCHDRVVFLKDFIVFDEGEARRKKVETELIKQFQRARPTCTTNSSDTTPGFQSWSAKLDGQGKFDPTANDDIVFAFCMAVYWMEKFIMGAIDTVQYEMFNWS